MEAMNIKPDMYSYNHLVLNFAKNKDLEMVEKLDKEAFTKYKIPRNKFTYNNILLCYAKLNQPINCEKVIDEMKAAGIEPDTVNYTTLIDAYYRTKNIDKCWEIFRYCRENLEDSHGNEMILSFMVRIASATHDSEKALRIYADLENEGYLEMAKPYNSIITALGSTKRYAPLAIEYWHKMKMKGIVPDNNTHVALFKATSKLGDI